MCGLEGCSKDLNLTTEGKALEGSEIKKVKSTHLTCVLRRVIVKRLVQRLW